MQQQIRTRTHIARSFRAAEAIFIAVGFDGIFVLRTNTDLNPLEAMLCYKAIVDGGANLPNSKTPALDPADLP